MLRLGIAKLTLPFNYSAEFVGAGLAPGSAGNGTFHGSTPAKILGISLSFCLYVSHAAFSVSLAVTIFESEAFNIASLHNLKFSQSICGFFHGYGFTNLPVVELYCISVNS